MLSDWMDELSETETGFKWNVGDLGRWFRNRHQEALAAGQMLICSVILGEQLIFWVFNHHIKKKMGGWRVGNPRCYLRWNEDVCWSV